MNYQATSAFSRVGHIAAQDIQIKIEEASETTQEEQFSGKHSPEGLKNSELPEEKVPKLRKSSKKISKKTIERGNGEKFVKFFEKWKMLKKTNSTIKRQTKFWFSSFNKTLNKTYIYREFFGSVRIHFRLAINEKIFNFDQVQESEWPKMFLNLTDFLRNEVFELEAKFSKEKKSIVIPVWIDSVNSFRIETPTKGSVKKEEI